VAGSDRLKLKMPNPNDSVLRAKADALSFSGVRRSEQEASPPRRARNVTHWHYDCPKRNNDCYNVPISIPEQAKVEEGKEP